ncbi:MAG: PPC domain-containing protein [Phycisphaerales bacterium]|nr:PPC domain-containing protein [Phycisphaerales bacterium]
MSDRAARLCSAVAILSCAGAAHTTDHHLPLRSNWNGLSQAGELNDPDAPAGFRPISDRALVADAQARSTGGTIEFNVVAFPWHETTDGGGDAGEFIASAQIPAGSGPIGSIAGDITPADVDLYAIDVCDVGSFLATTVGGAGIDTQLVLFDASGFGITFNDDSSTATQSTITSLFVPAPGAYYLAISGYDRDPVDEALMELWLDTPLAAERLPDGLGATSPSAA